MLFKRGAHVGNPGRATLRIRRLAVDAELVAGQWNIPALAPSGDFVKFRVNARPIPAIKAIANDLNTIRDVRDEIRCSANVFWRACAARAWIDEDR